MRSRVDVHTLVLADYSASAATIRSFVPPGFKVRPCFGGGEADVILIVTDETYRDLHSVPARPVRSASILTCADPPAGLSRRDATEPPFFILNYWNDSEALRRFLVRLGGAPGAAKIDLESTNGVTTFHVATAEGVVADGSAVSAHLGAPPLFPCAPSATRGRNVGSAKRSWLVVDFDKVESVCFATSVVQWAPGTPMTKYVGQAGLALVSIDTLVRTATYSFRSIR